MDLGNAIRDIMNDSKLYGSDETQIMLKTGFDCFDYLNGECTKHDDGTEIWNLGIDAGKIITIIGKSGSGKSTFGIQMGYNIIKNYDQGMMIVLDFESSNSEERIRMITGMSEEEYSKRVSIKKVGISTQSVYRTIYAIKKLKLENKDSLLIDNKDGVKDKDGKIVKIFPPTIILIDSLALMMPEAELGNDDMKGQMLATQMAKANTQLFKSIIQACMEANIICIFINHINQNVSTGPMPVAASINYLKQDETLPGGRSAQFLTNTLIKLTASSKLEEDKKYQIKGFEVKIELIKSRTAPAGRSVTMIYNQKNGFDNELSLLEFIKENGALKGGGISYFLDGLPDTKFRLSTFKQKLKEDEKFNKYFYDLGYKLLRESISNSGTLVSKLPDDDDSTEILEESSIIQETGKKS